MTNGGSSIPGSPVFEALSRDGVTALRLTAAQMAAIRAALAPSIAALQAKRETPAAGCAPCVRAEAAVTARPEPVAWADEGEAAGPPRDGAA